MSIFTQTPFFSYKPTDDLVLQQLELETNYAASGAFKFKSSQSAAQEKGQTSRTIGAQVLLSDLLPSLTILLENTIANINDGTDRTFRTPSTKAAGQALQKLGADVCALIACRTMFNSTGMTRTKTANTLGTALRRELDALNVKLAAPRLHKFMSKSLNKIRHHGHRAGVMGAVRREAGVELCHETGEFSIENSLYLGFHLMTSIFSISDIWHEQLDYNDKGHHHITVEFTPEGQTAMENITERVAWMTPDRPPMIVKPLPWDRNLRGGYLSEQQQYPFLKSDSQQFLNDLVESGALDGVFNAVNLLQETEYEIHKEVLEVAQYVRDQDLALGVIPCQALREIPANPAELAGIDVEVFKQTQPEAWQSWKTEAAAAHRYNEDPARKSKLLQQLRTISLAEDFADTEKLYFPIQADFRGRLYYVVNHLNPQGTDLAKGLLRFHRGVKLTKDGARHLAIHGSGLWGYDKESLEERVRWVEENEPMILSCATNPLDDLRWADADDGESAFQFLQFCFEWKAWKEKGTDHVSKMIVYIDGKCNGTQHHAALSRNKIEAEYVCLTPQERPDDLYRRVQDAVIERLAIDMSNNEIYGKNGEFTRAQLAEMLRELITRGVVKRGTMTFSYGLTQTGLNEQLRDDHPEIWARFENKDVFTISSYLGGIIMQSVTEVVQTSADNMIFLQKIADAMSHENLPCNWTTPDGFYVRQHIVHDNAIKVRTTLNGEARIKLNNGRAVQAGVGLQMQNIAKQELKDDAPLFLSYYHSVMTTAVFREISRQFVKAHKAEAMDAFDDELKEQLSDLFIGKHATLQQLIFELIKEALNKEYKTAFSDTRMRPAVHGYEPTERVHRGKQKNSIAPNFVHSLDSTHLRMTVNACAREGVIDFAAVHDSFGVHASNITLLHKHVREQFVKMYKEHDPLQDILDVARNSLECQEKLPTAIPEKGEFDIEDVLKADFAFL